MVTIKDNRKREHKFKELCIGEYFIYEGELYVVIAENIKLEDVCDDCCDSDVMNVLELKSGFLYRINEETIVDLVDVEISIFATP